MNKNSKILITGGHGLVGTNLVYHLLDKDYTGLLFPQGKYLDLTDSQEVDYYFKLNEPDYVINLAAKVGGIQANINDQFGFLLTNLQIQNNIIDACIRYKVKKCLLMGSSCIYPKDREILSEEDLLTGPMEETNLGYSLSKICGLKLAEYANKQYSANFISLMPCNVFGPWDKFNTENSHVISSLITKFVNAKINNINLVEIWGSGYQKREFIYVEDLVDCIEWAMINSIKTDTFLNVGPGKDYTIKEIAAMISDILNYKGEMFFNTKYPEGMKRKLLNVEKINRLGWKTKTDIYDGLMKTIEWYIKSI